MILKTYDKDEHESINPGYRGQSPKTARRAKNNQRAATVRELEAILEELMVEVSSSFPQNPHHLEDLKPWAHMTAMYVSEVVKRRNSPRETIVKKARKAVKRRIEKELADSYLEMKLPSVDDLHDTVVKPEADKGVEVE